MKLFTNKRLDCYRSIDTLPVFNWQAIHEHSDLTYLLKDKEQKLSKKQTLELEKVWRAINDEYIARFGISDDIIAITKKQKEIAQLKIKVIKSAKDGNADMSPLTFIKVAEIDLQRLIERTKSNEHYLKTIARVEKILGVKIDEMTTSVAKYVNYCQLCEESVKQKRAA